MFELLWWWILLLLPVPWLVQRWFATKQQDEVVQAGLFMPFADDLRDISQTQTSPNKHGKYQLLLWLAWLFLLLAAARPQWLGEPVELSRSGRDLMLAIDLSGSMQTRDFELSGQPVDRLTATKVIAKDFIARREGDRVGLILFGAQAYLQTPLTFDRKTVNQFLSEAVIGLAGKETAIGDAIGLAVKRLQHVKNASDLVLILLTDGVNTAGALKPEEAVKLAKNIGLRIYTIGMGADSMAVRSFFGTQMVNPSADLDEAMLQNIADETGGKYFRAKDTQGLQKIYALIDKLELVARDSKTFRPVRSLLVYPLAISFALLLLMLVLRKWR